MDLHRDDEEALEKAKEILHRKARDHARTPMQWDGTPHAGFCDKTVQPWMRVNDDYKSVNAEVQMKKASDEDEDHMSVLRFWQRGLANRKKHADVFVYGEYETVDHAKEGGNVFAYLRIGKKSGTWLVVLNFGGEDVEWSLPKDVKVQGWMAGNYVKGKPEQAVNGTIALKPWEGLLGKCE